MSSDGSGWSVVSDRLPAGGSLNGVACVSGDVCWAVGAVDAGNHSQLLIEHGVGGEWAVVRGPAMSTNPGEFPEFSGVTCVTAIDCWAVGSTASEGGPAVQPLIAHYAGAAWSVVDGPQISGSGGLTAVTCVSTDDCWAVGPSSLIEHYLGGSWVVETSQGVPGHAQRRDVYRRGQLLGSWLDRRRGHRAATGRKVFHSGLGRRAQPPHQRPQRRGA